jgi:hypothetical protein
MEDTAYLRNRDAERSGTTWLDFAMLGAALVTTLVALALEFA